MSRESPRRYDKPADMTDTSNASSGLTSGSGGSRKSKNHRSGGFLKGKKDGNVSTNPRSDTGIDELRGYTFQYGTADQQARFTKSKKALADYVGINSDCGQDLFTAIMEGVEPEFEEPEDPGKTATKGQLQRYGILLKKVLAKEERYTIEKGKVFRLIMGQCSQTMRNKVEAMPDYKQLEKTVDFVKLLQRMKELVVFIFLPVVRTLMHSFYHAFLSLQ
jgi:hypothetical protein